MRTRQLYAAVTASIAGTVYFDAPGNTTIRGIEFCVNPASGTITHQDYIEAEVSISATSQTATNDAQGVIAGFTAGALVSGTPATATPVGQNVWVPCNYPVRLNERIYLNVLENGTGTWRIRAIVWFD